MLCPSDVLLTQLYIQDLIWAGQTDRAALTDGRAGSLSFPWELQVFQQVMQSVSFVPQSGVGLEHVSRCAQLGREGLAGELLRPPVDT